MFSPSCSLAWNFLARKLASSMRELTGRSSQVVVEFCQILLCCVVAYLDESLDLLWGLCYICWIFRNDNSLIFLTCHSWLICTWNPNNLGIFWGGSTQVMGLMRHSSHGFNAQEQSGISNESSVPLGRKKTWIKVKFREKSRKV